MVRGLDDAGVALTGEQIRARSKAALLRRRAAPSAPAEDAARRASMRSQLAASAALLAARQADPTEFDLDRPSEFRKPTGYLAACVLFGALLLPLLLLWLLSLWGPSRWLCGKVADAYFEIISSLWPTSMLAFLESLWPF